MITTQESVLLGNASSLIAELTGLHFPETRWVDLKRGLEAAAGEFGLASAEACVDWLATGGLGPKEIETLASHLTVGETYFLRDPGCFAALEREILPRLVAKRLAGSRALRLWSAGCCTGEEAYSLAMTCARVLPDLSAWNVSVLATDINPKFIAKGEAGVYSDWSFRGVPPWFRRHFFSPALGGKSSIDPSIRRLVHFRQLNLAEDVYPSLHNHTSAMDVIFCRNVLMYLTPDHQRRVVAALHRCLVDDGYLVVSPAEASASLLPMFVMENMGDAILCRKTSQAGSIDSRRGSVPLAPLARERYAGAPLSPSPEAAPLGPVDLSQPVTTDVPVTFSVLGTPEVPVAPSASPPPVGALALARVLAGQGLLDEALGSCREAIAAERTDPVAHFLHAEICHELGRFEEETVALRTVLYLDRDFILAHCAFAELHKRFGRQRESRRHLAIALDLLSAGGRDEIVPESDGMTCGRLAELVRAMMGA